jgi:hypothetical protein
VLSGRGLCDELITRPEEFYRLWCVVVCDLETSRIGTPYIYIYIYIYDISSLRVKQNGILFVFKWLIHFDLLRMSKISLETCRGL